MLKMHINQYGSENEERRQRRREMAGKDDNEPPVGADASKIVAPARKPSNELNKENKDEHPGAEIKEVKDDAKEELALKTAVGQILPPEEEEASGSNAKLSKSVSDNTDKLRSVKKRSKKRRSVKKSSSFDRYRAIDKSASSRSRKKSKVRHKEYQPMKRDASSSVKKRKKKKSIGKKPKEETILRQIFNKAKSTFKVKIDNRLGDTYVPISDEFDKEPDVEPVFEPDEVVAHDGPPLNNENNGKLFINGLPFWCIKDEKPPPEYSCNFADLVKDVVDKKIKLLSALPEPNDLDPYHPADYLNSRDREYFSDPKRLLTNTIRSLVGCNGAVQEETAKSSRNSMTSTITWVVPTQILIYNRKCRTQKALANPFVPGQNLRKRKKRKKKKNGKTANALTPPNAT
ncbi:unnamed protein product [Caenorhabditis bovis]|uniref:Uncharacterized protein n=1 Tax=Caenorhabditis bovis TaxID=2654633 RepID=A0A8S1EUC3_9PELO|nr:unnamed protein product [Caenorhabditis bovis]